MALRAGACSRKAAPMPGRRGCRAPGAATRSRGRARAPVRDRDHLAAYAHVCGFTLRDELPPTYPHVLAFGCTWTLLARAPFSAVGVVHIANRIVQHRPLRLGETLALRVAGERAAAAPPRAHVRLRHRGARGRRAVWEGFATNLKRGDGDETAARPAEFEEPPVDRRSGGCPTTSAAATPPSPATTTRSTCTPERQAVRLPARDRPRHVDEGALPGRAAAPGRLQPSTSASRSRSCCPRRSRSARRTAASPSTATSRAS